MPGTRLFDVEWVGYLLAENLSDHDSSDFQQLPPWRTLVPVVTNEVANYTGQHLVATQGPPMAAEPPPDVRRRTAVDGRGSRSGHRLEQAVGGGRRSHHPRHGDGRSKALRH